MKCARQGTMLAVSTSLAILLPSIAFGEQQADESFRVYKKNTLAEIGPFEFERRAYTLETLDEMARVLRSFRDRKILSTTQTTTFGDSPVLDLSDLDGDGSADFYAYSAKSGADTQHFGFLYDLNSDGRVDYLMFSQGVMIAKPFKIVTTFYHMIDTNYDDRMDVWIIPDTDLDKDGFVEEGVFAWLYDTNFDGGIDKGEYLGPNVREDMACEKDVLKIKCVTGAEFSLGETSVLDFATSMQKDINIAME